MIRTLLQAIPCIIALTHIAHAEEVRLIPTGLHRLCTWESSIDQRNCEAYIRAPAERMQVTKFYLQKPCRPSPVSREDATRIGDMLTREPLNDEHLATLLVINYWSKFAGGIPCENQPFWTAAQLLQECQSDRGNRSPCKFYTNALIEFVKITDALSKKGPTFCSPTSTVSEGVVGAAFISWLERHPDLSHAPAALAFIDALAERFPCPPPTQQ